MHSIIEKYFKKYSEIKGEKISGPEDLNIDEKAKYDEWIEIFSEEEINVEKILKFCKFQKETIESQYTNPDNSDKKENYLKAGLGIYKSLIAVIEAPATSKENLINHIKQLINNIQ